MTKLQHQRNAVHALLRLVVHALGAWTTWRVARVASCSDFLLNTSLPEVVSARTMDFEVDLETMLEVIPRGTQINDIACRNCSNLDWTTKYGFVGVNILGFNFASDGLNEKGLSCAWLYLEGTVYPTIDKTSAKPVVASTCSYFLSNYATIGEVRDALTDQIQVGQIDERIGSLFSVDTSGDLSYIPLHLSLHDANGSNLVVEFLDGKVKIYDNPNGVLTNEPPFEQQLKALQVNGTGSLPGGYEPTDRFIRLSMLNRNQASLPMPKNLSYSVGTPDQLALSAAVHILQTVVSPYYDQGLTQWSVYRDHKHGKLYFQSTQNLVLRVIDLTRLDFADVTSRRAIPVTHGNWVVDETWGLLDPSNELKSNDMPPREQVATLLAAHQASNSSNSTLPK